MFKPKAKENREEFMARCMEEPEMVQEYRRQDMRAAACMTEWRAHKYKKVEKKVEKIEKEENEEVKEVENVVKKVGRPKKIEA